MAAPALRLLACVCVALALAGCDLAERVQESRHARQVARGKGVYDGHCVGCHGKSGDGRGPAAELLLTKPRDFRQATFKFRSTRGGALPTDADLYGTVTLGIANTPMPSFRQLEADDRRAVVQYVKTFSRRWDGSSAPATVELPPEPDDVRSVDALVRGRAVYARAACAQCHGVEGDANGTRALTLVDDWGRPSMPRDFTLFEYKRGSSRSDLVRTMLTGLNGTAMASFAEVLDPGEAWDLAAYLHYLSRRIQPQHRVALLLARDYPEEFAEYVGEATEATGRELAQRGARLSFPTGYTSDPTGHGRALTERFGVRSNDWYVALFEEPEAAAPGLTIRRMPGLVDANGRPNAEGLAAIVYLREGVGYAIMCGLKRPTLPSLP